MKKLFKIIKPFLKLAIILFAIIGIFTFNYHYRIFKAKSIASSSDKSIEYNEVFNFNKKGGNPLFWVKSTNSKTVFYFGELNNPNPIGSHYNFLKRLYNYEGCNIIAPITGTQGSPENLRTRKWSPKEDMRQAIQLWLTYTYNLPYSHKLIIITQGNGSLCAAAIQAKSNRKANEIIMLSPANAEVVNDDAPIGIRLVTTFFSKHISYIFPYLKNSNYNNDDEYHKMYPEYNVSNFYQNFDEIVYYEEHLLPMVKNSNVKIIWGEDDPMYKASGYKRITSTLMNAGNRVKPTELKRTGYDVLAGEEAKEARRIIYDSIRN